MQTISAEEFNKRYGGSTTLQFSDEKKKEGLFQDIKNAFKGGYEKVVQGQQEAKPGGTIGGLVSGTGKILGGTAEMAFSPLAPIFKPIGKGIEKAGERLAETEPIKSYGESAAYLPEEDASKPQKILENIANYSEGAGLAGAMVGGPKVTQSVKETASSLPGKVKEATPSIKTPELGGMIRDVVPTKQAIINNNVAKALDLTSTDLARIESSTGNGVGQWLADHNLIGTNKSNTTSLINSFFQKNYDGVRAEIAKVTDLYKANEVPRYTETLTALAEEMKGKLGLEKTHSEITNLLKKEDIKLSDVQRAKELMDDYYKLYKVTGDVKEGVAKQGLANVRRELQQFIENEVSDVTGADIRAMNNNVATAKSLGDAIMVRSPRGLTRANITSRDILVGVGLSWFGGPLVGIAAVFVKKMWESPTARLRVARYLDELSDAERARISESLKNGKVSTELQKEAGLFTEYDPYAPIQTIQVGGKSNMKTTTPETLPGVDVENIIPETIPEVLPTIKYD